MTDTDPVRQLWANKRPGIHPRQIFGHHWPEPDPEPDPAETPDDLPPAA